MFHPGKTHYIRITGFSFSFEHAPKKLHLKEVVGGFTVEVKYSYSNFCTSVIPQLSYLQRSRENIEIYGGSSYS